MKYLRTKGEIAMKSLLIKDTTKEERMAIIEESVGDDAGGCDGCSAGNFKNVRTLHRRKNGAS